MATTTSSGGTLAVAVEEIRVPENVRELDGEHVQALAGSIALQGILVPLVVTADSGQPDRWLLVAVGIRGRRSVSGSSGAGRCRSSTSPTRSVTLSSTRAIRGAGR
jgi:hypothetical protein